MIDIQGTPYSYDVSSESDFGALADRVRTMRANGALTPDVLYRIRRFFKIKNIYHSNAIEGNQLGVGETRQVIELGLTITGISLKDQAEARNLSDALDYLETLAQRSDRPIMEVDIRQLHAFVLKGINDGAGSYRSVSVKISGSSYEPPGPESVASQMQEFSSWLSGASVPESESFARVCGIVVAAAAHAWFVMIHPFIDGNGRVARLLTNLILMRYGFPIAIVTKEDRHRYYDALEASQESDLTPFSVLISECIEENLEEYERAVSEQKENLEWEQMWTNRFTQPERIRAENEFSIWRNAMELLRSYFRQTAGSLNDRARFGSIYFRDFENLSFNKYSAMRVGESARRTWFFRVDFRIGEKSARYLFFFGRGSYTLRHRCDVTLHVAREEPADSYYYERLENVNEANAPDLVEIGYAISEERFVARRKVSGISSGRIEEVGRQFFDDIVTKQFGY